MSSSLFASTARDYGRYRNGYPAGEVARLAALTGLDASATVLDVGCGSGQLTIPLADHTGHVIAIDPVEEMLAAGRAAAGDRPDITWVRGDAASLASLAPDGARAATFAASFHWTDRAAVLRVLDGLLAPDGAVVVINEVLADDPPWARAVNAVRAQFLDAQQRAATDRRREGHRAVLERSPFADVTRHEWRWERRLTVDEAVGLQFTYSFSTPALLGDRAAAFAAAARSAILALHPSGEVVEPLHVEVLVARR